MIPAVVLLASIATTSALVDYDCSGPTLNTTTFSTTDPLPCEVKDTEPTSENIAIQLLQLTDLTSTAVTQCKIEVNRTIYYCGMHSHVRSTQWAPIISSGNLQGSLPTPALIRSDVCLPESAAQRNSSQYNIDA